MSTLICLDCRGDLREIGEYYMVHKEVWAAAFKNDGKVLWNVNLCIGCLEKRLGRKLTPEDFTDNLVNRLCLSERSSRQRNRVGLE